MLDLPLPTQQPHNEPVLSYVPGSPERKSLKAALATLAGERIDVPHVVGGKELRDGEAFDVRAPHDHALLLATPHHGGAAVAQKAIDAALAAAPMWAATPFEERARILLRAADLLAGPWRATINAATMLGQSKTAFQAEIDSACELIDFLRFNVHFASRLAEQPLSPPGFLNALELRPLEGFVLAITPFNFTAIAGNLPTAPALMGNVVVWKPAHGQQLAAHYLMRVLEEAGLPPGVINMVTGHGVETSDVVLSDPDFAGLHFTGSTRVFQQLWRTIGENISSYRSYPRVVGETGGKDFVVAHPSADVDVLRTALVRGSFEYQGQKCSASSRAYVPRSIWATLRDDLAATVDGLAMGPVTDFTNFMGAVIDERAFARVTAAIDRAKADPTVTVVAGGTYDDSEGWYIRPTVIECTDPTAEYFTEEYFGPLLAVHVYDDDRYEEMLTQMESVASYALTGSIIAQDREAVAHATTALRFAAGNFYINDKSTGAVVGQQPFGGARASGTNDKAGAPQNLQRWTSTRSIKETFVPPKNHTYPHMG